MSCTDVFIPSPPFSISTNKLELSDQWPLGVSPLYWAGRLNCEPLLTRFMSAAL